MKKEILSRLILEHVKVTWEGKVGNYTQFVPYIQDDVLAGVAVLAVEGP